MQATPTRTTTRGATPAVPVRRPRATARERSSPWLFLAPVLILLAVFKFWPTVNGILDSFLDVRPYLGNQWVGLHNFTQALHDPDLRSATWHTLIDAAVTVTGSLVIGLGLALLLEGPARHLRIIRTAIFVPVVTAMVVVAELWKAWLFPGAYGTANQLLGAIGIGPLGFLSNPHQSLPSLMFIQVWKNAPYDMVIFIAGLASIDRQLYEVASLDGAGAWGRFRNVTLPGLRPITTIVLILGIIRGLRVFTEVYTLTGGGPGGSTQMIVPYTYQTGIQNNQLGYASAVATLLLVVTVVLSCLTLWWRNRRADA